MRGREWQTVKAMGLGAILASNIFLFAPFTLYVGNLDEFAVSFSTILSFYLRPALFLIAAFALVGVLLVPSIFGRYLALLAVIGVLLWFQANILVWDYGLLDGRPIVWAEGTWRGLVDLGVWIGAILLAMFFHRRLEKPVIHLAVAIFCLQLALSLFTAIQSASKLVAKSEIKVSASALPEMYRFSSHKNVLHVILDGFQSDVFEEIINDGEDGQRFVSALKGFVFFKDHMGVFPYTHMSVPAILSGKIYRNHIPRDKFLKEAIGGKTILSAAHDVGYEIDLAVSVSLLSMYTKGSYTNAYFLPPNYHVGVSEYELNDAVKLLDLALFRLVPHFLKRYVYNDQRWLIQSLLGNSEYAYLEFFAHTAFLRHLKENMSADRSTSVYKLLHLMLSHNPMVANRDCKYAGQVLPTVRATVKIQAKCGLDEVIGLLEKMKELDIYDDATIILMADHGAWVPPAGLIGYVQSDGKSLVMMDPTIVAMALPLMAIKPPGANGPLQISMAPSSIADTPATIASVLRLNEEFDGRSAFDLRTDELRERRHYTYQYLRSEWTADYLSPLQEFIVKGSVFDAKAWQPGDRFLPNGVVQGR